jgi:UDP-N-acetylmuramoylalanine--D-glutamate ligase
MKIALNHLRVLVWGLGETGLSALRWLKTQGAILSVVDTRMNPPNAKVVESEMPELKSYFGNLPDSIIEDIDLIVISPGVSLREPLLQKAIDRGLPIVGDIELFARYRPASAKLIAITGSNGKSTVTTLVGEMCKAAGLNTVVAGNIGLPVLDTLMHEVPDVYVLELSSFQLETTDHLAPTVSTVLNISEDHLDRYASMSDYENAKARIFIGASKLVVNRDDIAVMQMVNKFNEWISFGTDAPQREQDYGLKAFDSELWLCKGTQAIMAISDLKIRGIHNAINVLSAMALCEAIDIPLSAMKQAVADFKGLPHRVQWVACIEGVDFYDDSKGTNVGATYAALSGLSEPNAKAKVVLIAGGEGKEQDFSPLNEMVAQKARAVVLIGRDGHIIEQAISSSGVQIVHSTTLEEAVNKAFESAQQGDAVLLSPACASFDMFQNYEHRANVFIQSVKALEQRRMAS